MLITLLHLLLAAEPTPIWTLDDALAAFERSSPELEEARLKELSAAAGVEQAGLRPNPEASFSVGNFPLTANDTTGNGPGLGRNLTYSLGLSQALELGGKRGKRVEAARGALEEARAGRRDTRRLARHDVERAFWQAVSARAHREFAEGIRARYQETLRISRARFAADDISAADLEKVELEGSRQENDLADARAAEEVSIDELLRLVGPSAPPWVEVRGELKAPPFSPDRGELMRRAVAERPDVSAARQRVETARAALAVARSEAIPNLTLGLSYTHSQATVSGDNPDTLAATASLPIPLFHRNQGEIQKAQVELDSAETARSALESRVGREVGTAMARFKAAVEKVARYEGGALDRADRALHVAEKTWREGAASLLAFLEAERTFIALRADYLDTLVELRFARLEIERAVGGPFLETKR